MRQTGLVWWSRIFGATGFHVNPIVMPSRSDDKAIREANQQQKQRKRGGHKQEVATKSQIKHARKRRLRNRAMYHEAMAMAQELDIQLAPSTPVADVLEKVFRRTHALWQYAAQQVDMLDPDAKPSTKGSLWVYKFDESGNRLVVPSMWVEYENVLRTELFEQAAVAQKLNLDEARLRIDAAQLAVLSQAIRNAAKKAQLPDEMQRKLGSALREELATIEGTAEEAKAA